MTSRLALIPALLLLTTTACELPMSGSGSTDWRARMARTMPLLGQRNWIVIANSSFPMIARSGVQTVYIGGDQLTATATVLSMIDQSPHLRPVVTIDTELDHVNEDDAEGITDYRQKLATVLANRELEHAPRQEVVDRLIEMSRSFRVVLLKTATELPYSSVFIELDSGYWSSEAEDKLRRSMPEAEQDRSDT